MEVSSSLDLIDKDSWFSERNSQWPGVATSFRVRQVLDHKVNKYQDILICDSYSVGKVLILDGTIQFNEKNESFYHEMMVHTPLFSHLEPKKILLIGGGDGGCVRELCKHSSINEIIWVEIDQDVVNLCEKYFPKLSKSNYDKRVKLIINDGFEYITNVNKCKNNYFDIILCDSCDPQTGFANNLFTNEFYKHCFRTLKDNGIFCLQSGAMLGSKEELIAISQLNDNITNLFNIKNNNDIGYYSFYTPMYTDGQLGFLIARKRIDNVSNSNSSNTSLSRPLRKVPESIQNSLVYYNTEIHKASFVLPSFVNRILRSKL